MANGAWGDLSMLKNADINIRDPFVVAVPEERKYYLTGAIGGETWSGLPAGFNVYGGDDLVNWDGPIPAYRPAPACREIVAA